MNTDLYQRDFHAWTREQARLLQAGDFQDVDLTHLIEELESRAPANAASCNSV